ncbi:phytanoyl-CoA dioxygenase [Flavobacterium cyanobacteriorum]|uniref:Phytanoyl-CoA dioxygenase n=1 Tax=Flavobacterium cyanobacteriorum TaxID=2022802 RepID=A0A255ZX74_9FLAO|nr:phytanoyl-CoA dioxygenase family protein [Flavobacterium cyanobacteriorum]OYQ45504.1 phytanoyl-CoA dioxygenase [Flavobacterium cyanobacteriorum]
MEVASVHKADVAEKGFTVVDDVYSAEEIAAVIAAIEAADTSGTTFRKTGDLFAVRQFLKEFPELQDIIFNIKLKNIIRSLFGENYFVVKSIYFDKPPASNWYVACHQDLTISVKERIETNGYGPWTKKQGQFAVQPPVEILENIITIRLHLDNTNEANGALKVFPGSHLNKIYRPENINRIKEPGEFCNVKKGGIMIMKPLLMHSSGRTQNKERRRVIHIEFSSVSLPEPLQWAEQMFY